MAFVQLDTRIDGLPNGGRTLAESFATQSERRGSVYIGGTTVNFPGDFWKGDSHRLIVEYSVAVE